MHISRYRLDKVILIPILLFILISILSIYSAETLLKEVNYFWIKQILWYIAGFICIFLILHIGNEVIYRHVWLLYIIGNISLFLLLIFGKPINEAKCWFSIPGIGTIQPSEFVKIILILVLGKMMKNFNDTYPSPTVKEEFLFLLKVILVILPPSLLTFLEPDTGVVLIYLLITIIMLFVFGIRYRWFVILFSILFIGIGTLLFIYFTNNDLFIKIFGTSFFLRVDRLLDWSNKSGYQLENSLISIGSASLIGHGFLKTPLYFPEPQTDFIFGVFSSNFGLLGSLFLIGLIVYFDIRLIFTALKSKYAIDKYVIAGIVGMLLYQQIQNIGMTFGLMPITGITLPFISYGGSSLLSYMMMMGIIFNIANEKNN